jgi:pilus assembly protein CpaE
MEHERGPECGQATVEFLGVLPAALLVILAGWQLALAGQALWLSGNAARVAARAQAVGRDPLVAARSALPSYLRRDLVVRGDGERVSVRVAVPLLVDRWRSPIGVRATAALEQR